MDARRYCIQKQVIQRVFQMLNRMTYDQQLADKLVQRPVSQSLIVRHTISVFR